MTTAYQGDSTTVVEQSVVSANLDDEAVLLNVDTGMYYGLDGVGAEIWTLLTQNLGPAEILARLVDEYEVDAAELERDLSAFLERLLAEGLIRRRNA